jgi:hypothetical protein
MANIFDPVFIVHVWGKDFKFGKAFYGEGAFSAASDFFEEQKCLPDVTDADFLRKEGDRWVDVVPPFHRDVGDLDPLGREASVG